MSGLHIEGRFVAYQDLPNYSISFENKHNQNAINFCRAYISGVSEYPIKTSGSTGASKTINLTRAQLKASAGMTINALGLKNNYKALLCISTDHIGGKMMLVRGIELGMEMILIRPQMLPDIAGLPTIDFVALVPLQLQQLVASNLGRQFLEHCKSVIVGGSKIDTAVEKQLEQINAPIYHTFGMTESASHFALRKLTNPNKQQCYHTLEGVRISKDSRGCLIVKGETTNNISLITNDLIDIIDSNKFRWIGRWDRTINTGGYKVHPEKIEPLLDVLLKKSNIHSEYAVIGLPHSKWGTQVTLVLEISPENPVSLDLAKELKNKVHPYEIPKDIKFLKVFPRTASGKIDYLALTQNLAGL